MSPLQAISNQVCDPSSSIPFGHAIPDRQRVQQLAKETGRSNVLIETVIDGLHPLVALANHMKTFPFEREGRCISNSVATPRVRPLEICLKVGQLLQLVHLLEVR